MSAPTGAAACRAGAERGFTLLEVLVSLVILAIGMLGLTALQARGLQFTHDAYIRSQATVLAYDVVERMRNNFDNADDYIVASDPAGACVATGVGVTNDLNCWYERLAAELPGGTGSIAADAANANGYVITISWTDRETAGTNTQQWAVEP